jgi:hypothetical protein
MRDPGVVMVNAIGGVLVDSGSGLIAFLWPRLALIRYGERAEVARAVEELETVLPADVFATCLTVAEEWCHRDKEERE